jgi:hypothetical protein
MGGDGSGRRKTRERTLVEDCDYIDITFISKSGGTLYPILAEIIKTDSKEFLAVYYNTYWFGPRLDKIEYIELEKTYPFFGGSRYWMKCPGCDERVRKIYSPPKKTHFRCRTCYDLMYQSQESKPYDYWLRNRAKMYGMTPKQYEKAYFSGQIISN